MAYSTNLALSGWSLSILVPQLYLFTSNNIFIVYKNLNHNTQGGPQGYVSISYSTSPQLSVQHTSISLWIPSHSALKILLSLMWLVEMLQLKCYLYLTDPQTASGTKSNVALHLLNGLLPVSSVFLPLFPICNFAFINICLYTIPPSVFWSSS